MSRIHLRTRLFNDEWVGGKFSLEKQLGLERFIHNKGTSTVDEEKAEYIVPLCLYLKT